MAVLKKEKTMLNIILAVLGIHGAALNRARAIYARVIAPIFIFFVLLFFLGLGLNLVGIKGLNLLISLMLLLATVLLSLRAEVIVNILFAGIISGIIQTPQTMPQEIKKFLGWYLSLVQQVILWTSIVLFFLGTLDAQGNVGNIIGILAAVVLLCLIQAIWKIGKPWGKKFVYFYACFILCLFIFRFAGVFLASESDEGAWSDISGLVKTKYQNAFQNQTTYSISADTAIYSCKGGKIILSNMKYEKSVKIISMGKSRKQNGAVFVECGLPDPVTGQPGVFIGWIFSGDLRDITSNKETGENGQLVTVVRSTHDPIYADSTCVGIPPGNYRIEPADSAGEKTIFLFTDESRPRPLGDGQYFTVPEGKVLNGIKTDWDVVRVYKL